LPRGPAHETDNVFRAKKKPLRERFNSHVVSIFSMRRALAI
jgi:hypothetical protein